MESKFTTHNVPLSEKESDKIQIKQMMKEEKKPL